MKHWGGSRPDLQYLSIQILFQTQLSYKVWQYKYSVPLTDRQLTNQIHRVVEKRWWQHAECFNMSAVKTEAVLDQINIQVHVFLYCIVLFHSTWTFQCLSIILQPVIKPDLLFVWTDHQHLQPTRSYCQQRLTQLQPSSSVTSTAWNFSSFSRLWTSTTLSLISGKRFGSETHNMWFSWTWAWFLFFWTVLYVW